MKTIAIQEETFQLLNELKEKIGASSFNDLIINIIKKETKIPKSMFGSLKRKAKKFNDKERQEMWGEERV